MDKMIIITQIFTMARWQIVVKKSEATKQTKDQNKNNNKNKTKNNKKKKQTKKKKREEWVVGLSSK